MTIEDDKLSSRLLEQYEADGLISSDKAQYHRQQYGKLQALVLATYGKEKELMQSAKSLNNELLTTKIKLEKASIQFSEDQALINQLEKEKEKATKEVGECAERDAIITHEAAELQQEHLELVTQYNLMVEAKFSQREPEIQQLQGDIQQQLADKEAHSSQIVKGKEEKERLQHVLKELDNKEVEYSNEVVNLRRAFGKIRLRPDRISKHVEMIDNAIESVNQDVDRNSEKLKFDVQIVDQDEKKKLELEALQKDLEAEMRGHRETMEKRERELDKEKVWLMEEKNTAHEQMDKRMQLEIELQSASDAVTRKNDRLLHVTKEFDRVKKQLKKNQMLADSVKSLLPNLKSQVTDTQHQIVLYENENKAKQLHQAELKQEVDIFIAKYLRQEGVEQAKKNELKDLIAQVKEKEQELAEWTSEEAKQNRIIGMLGSQREMKAREASVAIQNEQDTVQELKIKELEILDYAKKCNETNNHLKEFSALYEVVKNERNKYVNLIQSSLQALAEMKEKIKILQNEVEVLRNESNAKDKALSKEKIAHQSALNIRDGLRQDTNKSQIIYRTKQKQVEQQIVEIDKLNCIINSMEKEMLGLKKKYETSVDSRNFTGVQLIDRNDELCILYEKSNLQEKTLKNGELALQEKDREIRMLQLQMQEQKRRILVARKQMPLVPEYSNKILDLQEELANEKQMVEILCRDLEAPKNTDRWRELVGEDPDEDQLVAKIQVLEDRINLKKEQLLEKELVLEEVSTLSEKLRSQASEGRDETLRLSKKVNDFQTQIKETTRKMMATVSELSMFQATIVKLEQEKTDRLGDLEESKWNMDAGRCPNEVAEREWQRNERDRVRKIENKQLAQQRKIHPLQGRTAAEPRPNAYVPEDVGIPKPYGGLAPFKPSDKGSTMRHIRKPEERDIEI